MEQYISRAGKHQPAASGTRNDAWIGALQLLEVEPEVSQHHRCVRLVIDIKRYISDVTQHDCNPVVRMLAPVFSRARSAADGIFRLLPPFKPRPLLARYGRNDRKYEPLDEGLPIPNQ